MCVHILLVYNNTLNRYMPSVTAPPPLLLTPLLTSARTFVRLLAYHTIDFAIRIHTEKPQRPLCAVFEWENCNSSSVLFYTQTKEEKKYLKLCGLNVCVCVWLYTVLHCPIVFWRAIVRLCGECWVYNLRARNVHASIVCGLVYNEPVRFKVFWMRSNEF